jgi:hypothetical protein
LNAPRLADPARARVCLPRAAALTESLVEPGTSCVSPSGLSEIRTKLVIELGELVDSADTSAGLKIGSFELAAALRYRERLGSDRDSFTPTARRCRRAIGIAAVARCARGHASTPHEAVRSVLDAGLEDVDLFAGGVGAPRPPWWAPWYAGLPRSGRSIVEAEAVAWATQLWTAVAWRLLGRPPTIGGRDEWWDLPGGRITLRGRADVRAWAGPRQALLVLGGRFPASSWRVELAFPALVSALVRGERGAPVRVVGLWPASGLSRTCDVDDRALSDAADALVSAVRAHVFAGTETPRG